jgi:hypothetical protein
MKENPETKAAPETAPKGYSFFQPAFSFVVTMIFGTLVTAVAGLFVYANVVDAKSRDLNFTIVAVIGLSISLVLSYFAARRTIELDTAKTDGPAFSLLKKYRRAITHVGADAQAGQYSIGEHYLRELLGRRGA